MGNRRERMVCLHRYDVKTTPIGNLSVWSACIFLNVVDVILLASLIAANCWAVQLFEIDFFTADIVIAVITTFVGFSFLIPGTVFTFVGLASCVTRALHTAFLAGRIVGMLILCAVSTRNLKEYFDFLDNLGNGSTKLSYTIVVGVLRYINVFLIGFYTLTLDRIRASGGNGREKLSAKDIDMERYRSTLPQSSGNSCVL